VLVGPNNAGKSSLIRALYSIQQGVGDLRPDIRVGASESQIEIELEELAANGEQNYYVWLPGADKADVRPAWSTGDADAKISHLDILNELGAAGWEVGSGQRSSRQARTANSGVGMRSV